MTQLIMPNKDRLEIADILRKHIADYQGQYPLWSEHRKIVYDLFKLPHRVSWRSYRSLQPLRRHAHCVPFMPQSALPDMPAHATRTLA